MIFSGWTVLRALPASSWIGVARGLYKVHGGVIRWAPGTSKAGQIVHHLIPAKYSGIIGGVPGGNPSDGGTGDQVPSTDIFPFLNTLQLLKAQHSLNNLTDMTKQVLRISQATMALSGLNLVVSAVGFTLLYRKLDKVENHLVKIAHDVKAIRDLLERRERAELRAALRDLQNIGLVSDANHRHTMLHSARRTLVIIQESYQELLGKATTPEEATGVEELVCLTALSQSRCLAELEIVELAGQELQQFITFWQQHVRRIGKAWFIEKHPRRFLYSDFVKVVPTTSLAEWFDFIEGTNKGLDWIDYMREQNDPTSKMPKIGKTARKIETDVCIPFMYNVMARSNLLQGYVGQYELMKEQGMTVDEFVQAIYKLQKELNLKEDDFIILAPQKAGKDSSDD